MPLNIESKTSYYQFDSAGMLIVPGDDLSWRDSIGRTVLAWIAYGKPEELFDAIEHCYSNLNLYRHPTHRELSSRDHWSYFLIQGYLKYNISRIYTGRLRMRGMNNWMKALTGNKRAEKRYYFWAIPGAYFGNFWLRVCRLAGRISPEQDNDWWIFKDAGYNNMDALYFFSGKDKPPTWNYTETNGWNLQTYRTSWQNIWGKIILNTIPAFTLHIKAWQIYVMPESKRKVKLQRILHKRVGKSNILVRLLLGDPFVTQKEVDNYPHMTGYRPGVYLDESCRRDIREMTEQEREFNSYEVDLIQWLWD